MKSNLRVHISPVGFEINRVIEPLIRERADKVYLVLHAKDDKATKYVDKISKTLSKRNQFLKIEKRTTDIWDLFECLNTYKKIIKEEWSNHIFINVSTGSKIAAIAGTLACMIWKGTPYYAHEDYMGKTDSDGLPNENITGINELPVYSINKPKQESLEVLKILVRSNEKWLRKSDLIEELEDAGLIGRSLRIAAKHSRLRGLLNPISIGLENPLIEVEYRGRQSKVAITTQGESTLKIFG